MRAALRGRVGLAIVILSCGMMIGVAEAKILLESEISDPPVVLSGPIQLDFYPTWQNPDVAYLGPILPYAGAYFPYVGSDSTQTRRDIWRELIFWRLVASWQRRSLHNAGFFSNNVGFFSTSPPLFSSGGILLANRRLLAARRFDEFDRQHR
jgi:hypothetical protein